MAKQANLRPVDDDNDIAPVTVGNPSAAADSGNRPVPS